MLHLLQQLHKLILTIRYHYFIPAAYPGLFAPKIKLKPLEEISSFTFEFEIEQKIKTVRFTVDLGTTYLIGIEVDGYAWHAIELKEDKVKATWPAATTIKGRSSESYTGFELSGPQDLQDFFFTLTNPEKWRGDILVKIAAYAFECARCEPAHLSLLSWSLGTEGMLELPPIDDFILLGKNWNSGEVGNLSDIIQAFKNLRIAGYAGDSHDALAFYTFATNYTHNSALRLISAFNYQHLFKQIAPPPSPLLFVEQLVTNLSNQIDQIPQDISDKTTPIKAILNCLGLLLNANQRSGIFNKIRKRSEKIIPEEDWDEILEFIAPTDLTVASSSYSSPSSDSSSSANYSSSAASFPASSSSSSVASSSKASLASLTADGKIPDEQTLQSKLDELESRVSQLPARKMKEITEKITEIKIDLNLGFLKRVANEIEILEKELALLKSSLTKPKPKKGSITLPKGKAVTDAASVSLEPEEFELLNRKRVEVKSPLGGTMTSQQWLVEKKASQLKQFEKEAVLLTKLRSLNSLKQLRGEIDSFNTNVGNLRIDSKDSEFNSRIKSSEKLWLKIANIKELDRYIRDLTPSSSSSTSFSSSSSTPLGREDSSIDSPPVGHGKKRNKRKMGVEDSDDSDDDSSTSEDTAIDSKDLTQIENIRNFLLETSSKNWPVTQEKNPILARLLQTIPPLSQEYLDRYRPTNSTRSAPMSINDLSFDNKIEIFSGIVSAILDGKDPPTFLAPGCDLRQYSKQLIKEFNTILLLNSKERFLHPFPTQVLPAQTKSAYHKPPAGLFIDEDRGVYDDQSEQEEDDLGYDDSIEGQNLDDEGFDVEEISEAIRQSLGQFPSTSSSSSSSSSSTTSSSSSSSSSTSSRDYGSDGKSIPDRVASDNLSKDGISSQDEKEKLKQAKQLVDEEIERVQKHLEASPRSSSDELNKLWHEFFEITAGGSGEKESILRISRNLLKFKENHPTYFQIATEGDVQIQAILAEFVSVIPTHGDDTEAEVLSSTSPDPSDEDAPLTSAPCSSSLPPSPPSSPSSSSQLPPRTSISMNFDQQCEHLKITGITGRKLPQQAVKQKEQVVDQAISQTPEQDDTPTPK